MRLESFQDVSERCESLFEVQILHARACGFRDAHTRGVERLDRQRNITIAFGHQALYFRQAGDAALADLFGTATDFDFGNRVRRFQEPPLFRTLERNRQDAANYASGTARNAGVFEPPEELLDLKRANLIQLEAGERRCDVIPELLTVVSLRWFRKAANVVTIEDLTEIRPGDV
jgi:hypothetical protein